MKLIKFYIVLGIGFEGSWWRILATGRTAFTVKFVFISAFLLHPHWSPATSVFIPVGFPRNLRGPRHAHPDSCLLLWQFFCGFNVKYL